jgi:hypothetical protein
MLLQLCNMVLWINVEAVGIVAAPRLTAFPNTSKSIYYVVYEWCLWPKSNIWQFLYGSNPIS